MCCFFLVFTIVRSIFFWNRDKFFINNKLKVKENYTVRVIEKPRKREKRKDQLVHLNISARLTPLITITISQKGKQRSCEGRKYQYKSAKLDKIQTYKKRNKTKSNALEIKNLDCPLSWMVDESNLVETNILNLIIFELSTQRAPCCCVPFLCVQDVKPTPFFIVKNALVALKPNLTQQHFNLN